MANYAAHIEYLAPAYGVVPALIAPRWPSPLGVLDLYGAHRLSVVVNWIATDNGKRSAKARASALQEVVGILIVLFGGETFLCERTFRYEDSWLTAGMCTGQPPSWLIDPSVGLMFALIRTSPNMEGY